MKDEILAGVVDRALSGQQPRQIIGASPPPPQLQHQAPTQYTLLPPDVMRMVEVGILTPEQGFGMIFSQQRPAEYQGASK